MIANANKRQTVCPVAHPSIFFPDGFSVRTKQTNKTSLNNPSPSFSSIQGSSLPLSIIIVGVGPAEFDGECFISVSRLLSASASRWANTPEMGRGEEAGRHKYLRLRGAADVQSALDANAACQSLHGKLKPLQLWRKCKTWLKMFHAGNRLHSFFTIRYLLTARQSEFVQLSLHCSECHRCWLVWLSFSPALVANWKTRNDFIDHFSC